MNFYCWNFINLLLIFIILPIFIGKLSCISSRFCFARFSAVVKVLVPSSFDNAARSIDNPAPTLLASRKHINLAAAFLVNPQYQNAGSSVNAPAPTVIATQRSRPLSLATSVSGDETKLLDKPGDSQAMRELKDFMRINGIADIFMRMLKVIELKRIQGFPDSYALHGNQNDQKKFIGNSVETGVVKAWFRAIAGAAPFVVAQKSVA